MATHRSLNKLEFKAHMSIHNQVDVPEGEAPVAHYARDRFGKDHRISVEGGPSRVRRRKKTVLMLLAFPFAGVLFTGNDAFSEGRLHRSTDVKVESSAMNEALINQKINNVPDEKPSVGKGEDTSIGFNEDGDPNMSLRF